MLPVFTSIIQWCIIPCTTFQLLPITTTDYESPTMGSTLLFIFVHASFFPYTVRLLLTLGRQLAYTSGSSPQLWLASLCCGGVISGSDPSPTGSAEPLLGIAGLVGSRYHIAPFDCSRCLYSGSCWSLRGISLRVWCGGGEGCRVWYHTIPYHTILILSSGRLVR